MRIHLSKDSVLTKIRSVQSNKTFSNGILFSFFSFINRGFIFLLLLILANYIAPKEYGYLSLFSTVVMVISYIICLSSEGYMSVSYFQEGKENIKYTFSTILFLGICSSIVLLLVITLGGEWLANVLSLPQYMLYIAVFICFATAMSNVNLDFFRLKEQVKKYGLFSCGNAFLNFVVSILLVKFCLLSWQGRVYAQLGCALLFGGYALFFFHKHKCYTSEFKNKILPILAWSLPIIPHHATNFLRQGMDRYIINYNHSLDDVGLFSFALNIANIITMIGFGFNQSNSVDIYKTLGDKDLSVAEKKKSLNKQKHLILTIYAVCSLLIVVSCYFLIPILLPKYEQSMNYFLILSIYGFFVCFYLLYTNYLFYFKKTKLIMYASVGSSVLHLLLSLTLTKYSLYYTCLIYCISQGCFALIICYYANKSLKTYLVE